MARETDNAANATEQAAKGGGRVVAETTKVGERYAAETAERIESASRAYGGAVEALFKAVQDYNAKLIQVFQTNAEANLRLGQTLMQTRSPADFVETMSRSMREGAELIAGQTKDLAALRREAARRVMEAMASGR